jgi:hypothetical protein
MNIIKGIIKDVAKDVAVDVAVGAGISVLDTAVDAVRDTVDLAGGLISDASERRKIRKANDLDRYQMRMEKKNPANRHLWMTEQLQESRGVLRGRSRMTVCNFFTISGRTIYVADSCRINRRMVVTLCDDRGVPNGTVTEQQSVHTNPLSLKNNEKLIDLNMSFRDEQVGLVTNAVWRGKWFLMWDVVKWGMIRKRVGVTQIVTEDDKLIAEITTRVFNSKKLTFIDIEDDTREKAVVMFVLAQLAYEKIK